jgi:hypothetical protein
MKIKMKKPAVDLVLRASAPFRFSLVRQIPDTSSD